MQSDGETDDGGGNKGRIKWLKYVQHHRIAEYEADGWVVVDRMEDIHHGDYAVLMERKTWILLVK